MKISKAEKIALIITALIAVLAAGFFLGRRSAHSVVVVEAPPEQPEIISVSETEAPAPERSLALIPEEDSAEAPAEPEGSGRLDLNTATLLELETLPGIGPILGQRILDYRDSIGGFTHIEELKYVDGIGDKIFDEVKDFVEVGTAQ